MGKIWELQSSAAWSRLAACVLLAVVVAIGCASGGGTEPREADESASDAQSTVETESDTSAADTAVEIGHVAVASRDGDTEISVVATEPLTWTQYRDQRGRLIVEIPNSRPAAALGQTAAGAGAVDVVEIETEDGDRPLTRLTIRGVADTEHQIAAAADGLVVTVDGVGEAAAATLAEDASAPSPDDVDSGTSSTEVEEPVIEETETTAMPAMSAEQTSATTERTGDAGDRFLGTPEEPYVAPEPSGPAASRLHRVEVIDGTGGATIRLHGDGTFAYSTFELHDPDRFVVDLPGVVNASRASAIAGTGVVDRVRVAQFRSTPEPISRVVFDLAAETVPTVERTDDGLVVSLREVPVTAVEVDETTEQPPTLADAPTPETEQIAPTGEGETDAVTASDVDVPAMVAATPPAPTEPTTEPTPEPVQEESGTPPDVVAVDEATDEPEESEERIEPVTPEPLPESSPSVAGWRQETSDVALFEAQEVDDEAPPAAVVRREQTEAFQEQTVGGEERRYVGEPITLSLNNADIREVLRTFAKISGLNLVVQPEVSGSVTVELEQVPWDQALDQILKINGLGYELEGNIMRIAPRAQLREEAEEEAARQRARQMAVPLRTVMKRISYADAGSIASLLRSGTNSILSQRGSVIVDGRTNTLIIKELPEYMDTVLAIIDQIDVAEPQVLIEARIIETTKRFSRNIGIQWGTDFVADAAHGNTTGVVFPNNVQGEGSVNLLGQGGNNGLLNIELGNVLNTFNLDLTLRAAENEGLINILSTPKIATLNNQTARIESGLQIPIQTVANNTVSVQFVNASLELEVTPHVTAEGTVLMDIQIAKREPQLAFAVVGATNAPIDTKEAETRVIVRDGGTTVIGGIYQVSTDQGEDRVPGLANIPILGHLFKNKRRSDENQELLIFITPRVIKL